jgi:RND family efflux transporter MFP subunit
VEPVKVNDYYEAAGTVRARITSAVSSRVPGRVIAIPVRAGDRVRAGQVLLKLDDSDAAQRVRAAEQAAAAAAQNRALAESTYERSRKLYEGRAITGQEMQEIETRKKIAGAEYSRAAAALEEAKVQRGFTVITSPEAGTVTEKKIDVGSMASPGVPLMVVESGKGFHIEAYVDEALSADIRPGTPVGFRVDAINLKGKGDIFETVPAVDPATRSFLIKITATGPALKSGLFAKVRIPLGQKTIVAVPREAIVDKGQLTGVYTVSPDGIVTYRLIRYGKEFDGAVEVLSGLKAGDRIIAKGADKAVDGGILREGSAR